MPVGSRAPPALISQVSDLIQLVKELYADNQHLKKTIFDLSCVGFPGDNKPESVDQTEVRRNALIITSSSQRVTAPHTCQGCICSGGSLWKFPLLWMGFGGLLRSTGLPVGFRKFGSFLGGCT